jgi:hypothetical protein
MSQCKCFTKNGAGTQCSRKAKNASNYCYQHQNCSFSTNSTNPAQAQAQAQAENSKVPASATLAPVQSQVPVLAPSKVILRKPIAITMPVSRPRPMPKPIPIPKLREPSKNKMSEELGLIGNMIDSYPPWESFYDVEESEYVDIGNYRFHYPTKTVENNYIILVVLTQDLKTKEEWFNPYYLSVSTNMFRYALYFNRMFYKGFHYVSSTFPHIKLQHFLHKAYLKFDSLKDYKDRVLVQNKKTWEIMEILNDIKIYEDETFNIMNMIPCGLHSLIFVKKPQIIIPDGDLSSRPIRIDELEGTVRDFYEYMLNSIMPESENVFKIGSKDYKKILEQFSDLFETNFTVIEETRKYLFSTSFKFENSDTKFNMSVYSVIVVSNKDIYKRFKVLYSVYQYYNEEDSQNSGKTYTSIIVIQVDNEDINHLGLPKVIVAAGAYTCKIVEYLAQGKFIDCPFINSTYCFMGNVMTDLWPSKIVNR